MLTIGIKVNQEKPKAQIVLNQLVDLLEQKGVQVKIDSEVARQMGRDDLALPYADFPQHVGMIFVIGGDGTLLGAARKFASHHLPFLGFNVGNLGFLSEAEPHDLTVAVSRVINGDYYVEKRMMLQAELIRQGEVIEREVALNEVGIAKGSFSRMITCSLRMDGNPIGVYSGDGILLSTPTGSTAYSLSSGGPIVWPEIQTLLFTPICPHTLTARPMILPEDAILEVHVSAPHQEMGLTIDGQVGFDLHSEDVIRVSKSPYETQLIKWQERSFFHVLRQKLYCEKSDEGHGEI